MTRTRHLGAQQFTSQYVRRTSGGMFIPSASLGDLETLSLVSSPEWGFSFDGEIVDFSGNSTPHTPNFGVPSYESAPTNEQAIDFDATNNDRMDITTTNAVAFTMEVVFRMTDLATSRLIAAHDSGGGSSRPWVMFVLANGDLNAYANNSAGPSLTTVGTNLDDNSFHHVVLTHVWATGVTNHWVDGVNVGDDLVGSTAALNHGTATLGSNDAGGFLMTGAMAFAAYYPTVLADAVIEAHYAESGV